MKILISAFACGPGLGSEPGLGWGIAREISKQEDVWVLTDSCWRESIEAEIEKHPLRVTFCFVDLLPGIDHRIFGYSSNGIYYLFWQLKAFLIARRLNAEVRFDLVHHVSYPCPWMPSFLGWLGIPFIWTAGTRENTPLRLLADMSWRSWARELSRYVFQFVLGRCFVGAVTASRASLILAPDHPQLWDNAPLKNVSLGGLPENEIADLSALTKRTDEPFRVASIGRLLGVKGFALGLRAFAKLSMEFPGAEYWIVGAGPERRKLEQLAMKLGCRERVQFWARLSRADVLALLERIDVLIHPSIHDQCPYIVLEAMAAGKPVVCLDIAGPSLQVPDGGGARIQRTSRDQIAREIHVVLRSYAMDRDLCVQAGLTARRHVEHNWQWNAVAGTIREIYKKVARHQLLCLENLSRIW